MSTPSRLRLMLRDLGAGAAFASMAVSGQLPAWALGLFALALICALLNRRVLAKRNKASAVLLLAAGSPSVMLAAAGAFGVMFTFPLISGCAQAIWQRKVPARMQGSVLSVRRVLVQTTLPLAYLVAGPLADRVFEPLMADGGGLSASLGSLLGVGPGRGVALMLVLLAVLTVSVTWLSALSPRLRRIEQELPDETSPAQGEAPVPVAAS